MVCLLVSPGCYRRAHDGKPEIGENGGMIGSHLHTIMLVWRACLVGGVAIITGVILGWFLGQARGSGLVRLVVWWVEHVVRPLVRSRSWFRRAAIIAANNALVCLVAVLLGAFGSLAWLAVGGLGLSLGVSMRLTMGGNPFLDPGRPPTSLGRGLEVLGLLLNLLEVPALLMAAGLCLGQGAWPAGIGLGAALGAFVWCVVPLLAIGAAGEALWMCQYPDLPRRWPWSVTADQPDQPTAQPMEPENGRHMDEE